MLNNPEDRNEKYFIFPSQLWVVFGNKIIKEEPIRPLSIPYSLIDYFIYYTYYLMSLLNYVE